jgi:hypothetical protein
MNDVVMGDIAADTLDGRRFAHVIRKSVHDVVEGTLAKAGGNADARQDIRAAGERLGDALIAYADGGERPARHVPHISPVVAPPGATPTTNRRTNGEGSVRTFSRKRHAA